MKVQKVIELLQKMEQNEEVDICIVPTVDKLPLAAPEEKPQYYYAYTHNGVKYFNI